MERKIREVAGPGPTWRSDRHIPGCTPRSRRRKRTRCGTCDGSCAANRSISTHYKQITPCLRSDGRTHSVWSRRQHAARTTHLRPCLLEEQLVPLGPGTLREGVVVQTCFFLVRSCWRVSKRSGIGHLKITPLKWSLILARVVLGTKLRPSRSVYTMVV